MIYVLHLTLYRRYVMNHHMKIYSILIEETLTEWFQAWLEILHQKLQDHEEKNLQNIFPSPISPVLASSIILAMTPST